MKDYGLMDRREMLQRAMLIVAGSTIAMGSAGWAAEPKRAVAGLTAAQFSICSAVADTIVPRTDTPGAVDVGVPKLFDALLRDWASPAHRAALVGALEAINASAREQAKKGFAELSPDERTAFLTPYDVNALKAVPRTDGKTGLAAMFGEPSVVAPGYAKLKELIVILYYYSEPALTQELPYEHAPGKWQPSIPVTPETRSAGGPGAI
jgi:hypothetical protein